MTFVGGKVLQNAIAKFCSSSTNLFPGSAFITEAGENRSKFIVHCVEAPGDL